MIPCALTSGPAERSLLVDHARSTDREREILNLIVAGKNNQEISGQLFLSLKTVRNYVSNIFIKLQVAEAIIRAREAGLGRDIPRA